MLPEKIAKSLSHSAAELKQKCSILVLFRKLKTIKKKNVTNLTMAAEIGNNYTELCSERTIFSDDQGFFGEMFTIVKNSCTEKWLKNVFESEISDATKLKLLFDEPDASDMLLGTLEHVQSVYRQKESAFSHARRKQGEMLHRKGELNDALLLLTQAILRAPAKGNFWHFVFFFCFR